MCALNAKASIKMRKQRIIPNNAKKIKLNLKKYLSQNKSEKEGKRRTKYRTKE